MSLEEGMQLTIDYFRDPTPKHIKLINITMKWLYSGYAVYHQKKKKKKKNHCYSY